MAASRVGEVIPAALPEDNRWAYWRFHATADPVDFESECKRFIAMRQPCQVCGRRQELTPMGIALEHDRDRHGVDAWKDAKKGKGT